MVVKSIIDVDVQDGAFTRFRAEFDKYQKALKDSPKEWAKVTAGIGRTRAEFDQIVKQQIASIARTKLMAEATAEAERRTKSTADRWREIAASTREAGLNVKDTALSLLRWGAATTIVGGLLGGGGLFGLDVMAGSVGARRRAALGLGAGYGEARSFGVNLGRFVDADSFLGGVADARADVTKRAGFYGAGLSERDLRGSTGEVSARLLDAIRKIAKNTDPNLYGQVIAARGLGVFGISTEDMRRLASTPDAEYARQRRRYSGDIAGFDLAGETQRAWQDLHTQLSRAGHQIENTLVKGLLPLVPGLEKMSVGVEKVVASLLGAPALKKWMEEAGAGLESLAKYVGTPEFERKVEAFARGIGEVADAVVAAARFIASLGRGGGAVYRFFKRGGDPAAYGGVPTPGGDAGAITGPAITDWLKRPISERNNNPGNIRFPGGHSFRTFETPEDGIRAMAWQLGRYFRRDKIDTVEGLISKWAPSIENDTAGYIKAVGKRTGYRPDEKLNLNDPEVMARLISAITKQENHKSNWTPGGVRIILENNTGGNTISIVNAVAGAN